MLITMKSLCCSFCDWANKGTIHIPTSGETLVNTYFTCEHPPLHVIQESGSQTPICPAPRKINGCKEYFTIRAISEHIIHHCVAIIAAIHCALVDTIVSALGWERNPIHETHDVVHQRFSLLDHSSILPHFFSAGELYPRKQMRPQSPHSFFKHLIYLTANGWGDAKNDAKMFIVHLAPQIKKK
jgi:hypothetical protein